MSDTVYVVKGKFKLPSDVEQAPDYSRAITGALWGIIGLAALLFAGGVATLYLPFIVLSFSLLLIGAVGSQLRKVFHSQHLKRYYSAVERRWLLSPSFLEMKKFLELLGVDRSTAMDITTNFGVAGLAGDGYQIARGYYRLTDENGRPSITAVEIGGEKTRKENLKVVAKLLYS